MNGSIEKFQCSPRDYSCRNSVRGKFQLQPIPSRLQGPGTLYHPIYESEHACYQGYYVNTTVRKDRVIF